MKVYITSSSGVGKTTLINALSNRGFTAFDIDETPGAVRLEVKVTGEAAEWPKGYVDWSHYAWNINEKRLQELLGTDKTVFISGFAANQAALYDYFDKLIILTINPVEHEKRLRARPKREFGDEEQNLQDRLRKYEGHLQELIAAGFIPIDNSGPISTTLDHILRLIHED